MIEDERESVCNLMSTDGQINRWGIEARGCEFLWYNITLCTLKVLDNSDFGPQFLQVLHTVSNCHPVGWLTKGATKHLKNFFILSKNDRDCEFVQYIFFVSIMSCNNFFFMNES